MADIEVELNIGILQSAHLYIFSILKRFIVTNITFIGTHFLRDHLSLFHSPITCHLFDSLTTVDVRLYYTLFHLLKLHVSTLIQLKSLLNNHSVIQSLSNSSLIPAV